MSEPEQVVYEEEYEQHPGLLPLIIVTITVFQLSVLYWKKKSPYSYHFASLMCLWLFPFAFSLILGFGRFIAYWIFLSIANFYLIVQAAKKPLHPHTPRLVYKFYRTVFKISFAGTVIAYVCFILWIFLPVLGHIVSGCFTLAFYCTYTGVLCRDLIDFLATSMASSIGYYNKEGLPTKHLKADICAICGGYVVTHQVSTDRSSELDTFKPEQSIKLDCQHIFHEFCIKGWCSLGKKDFCPYCKEKVDQSAIENNPWQSKENMFGSFLDFIRYLVVWLPCVLISIDLAQRIFHV